MQGESSDQQKERRFVFVLFFLKRKLTALVFTLCGEQLGIGGGK
jgi:hypothetical protein